MNTAIKNNFHKVLSRLCGKFFFWHSFMALQLHTLTDTNMHYLFFVIWLSFAIQFSIVICSVDQMNLDTHTHTHTQRMRHSRINNRTHYTQNQSHCFQAGFVRGQRDNISTQYILIVCRCRTMSLLFYRKDESNISIVRLYRIDRMHSKMVHKLWMSKTRQYETLEHQFLLIWEASHKYFSKWTTNGHTSSWSRTYTNSKSNRNNHNNSCSSNNIGSNNKIKPESILRTHTENNK